MNKGNVNRSNIIKLGFGRVISDLGSAVFGFALSLYVLDLTGSAEAFSLILIAATVPRLFVNILAGVFADRYSRKKIMVISDILSGIAVLSFVLFFQFYSTKLSLFVIYALILSVINSFFNIAVYAAIPDIVDKDHVERANSVLTAVGGVISIFGPILGALAYQNINFEIIFIIDGISFIISGIFEMFLIFKKRVSEKAEENTGGYLNELKMGYIYLMQNKIIQYFLYFAAIVQMIFMPLIILVLPYLVYNVMKMSGVQLSLIEASWAVGAIVGSVIISMRKSNHKIMKKFFLLLEMQAILFFLWIFPNFGLFAGVSEWTIVALFSVLLIIIGFMNSMQNILMFSHLQLMIPPDLRGRVFSVVSTALMVSVPLGMWLYGRMLEKFNSMYVIMASGVLLFLICLISSRITVFRNFFNALGEEIK